MHTYWVSLGENGSNDLFIINSETGEIVHCFKRKLFGLDITKCITIGYLDNNSNKIKVGNPSIDSVSLYQIDSNLLKLHLGGTSFFQSEQGIIPQLQKLGIEL